MARWRFEALKSRCIIINRETLLEEHKISFEANPKDVVQLAQKLDTPTVRPIIVDTSSRILQPSIAAMPAKSAYTNAGVISAPTRIPEQFERPIKIERVSAANTTNQIREDIIQEESFLKPRIEFQNAQTYEAEILTQEPMQEDALVQIKDSNEFSKPDLPIEICRSPLKPLQQLQSKTHPTRQSDISNHPDNYATLPLEQTCDISAILSDTIPSRSSINAYVPQYRKISIDQRSMASLEKNIARLKTSSTPNAKVRSALKFHEDATEETCLRRDNSSAEATCNNNKETKPKVNFTDSTIEAFERKELGMPSRRHVLSATALPDLSVESSENSRPKFSGIMRRVMVKSKKPTAFPK